MSEGRFLRKVMIKALVLFVALNLLFAALNPLPALGSLSLYNHIFPGRQRFPFGENPAISYNVSLYNLNAMFNTLALDGTKKGADEYRVLVVGDSSVWGTLLHPEQTLAGQIKAADLKVCGKTVRAYNLGYPTLSLTKDVLILDLLQPYQPDQIVWLTTLESFPRSKQLASPIVANNAKTIVALIAKDHLQLDPADAALIFPNFWQRTLIGQRRALADLLRLQYAGVMWAATGIDQVYPTDYTPAERDLQADATYAGWKDRIPADGLALDALDAGFTAAGSTPVLLVNEPMLISSGKNSDIRYNFYYPRGIYDQYRQILSDRALQNGWQYLDLWNLVPQTEFTNSAIHLTPAGESLLAHQVESALGQTCK